jgi:gluconate 5-dehydrogenase
MNNLFSLKGKTALVTGSSGGIGFVIAQGLGRAGAKVLLNGRNPEKLEAAQQKLQEEEIDSSTYIFDVCKEVEVTRQIKQAEQDNGGIDILVNNAGIQIRGPLEDYEEKNWYAMIDTHLGGAFRVSKAVVKSMISCKSGKIINICSLMSEVGRKSIAPYTAAKGGLKNLTKAMAIEWAEHNIQVNAIGPGYFMTDMTTALSSDEEFNNWLIARTPAKRWGKPEELVGAAVYLASKASDFVCGQVLYVDGGILASI